MTLTVQHVGEEIRCNWQGCRALIGVLLEDELHVRAGKQVVIAKSARATCPLCGHLHLLTVTEAKALI